VPEHISSHSQGFLADPARRAYALGLLTVVPLMVWWAGFFPGFMSSDSIDQLGQVERFSFSNHHPAINTIFMWALMSVWHSPAAVTLFQVLAMAGLLALAATRFVRLGAPLRLAVGAVWVAAALPAIGTTTNAVWKDVPYTLALVWVFTELLLIAQSRSDFWSTVAGPVRLGVGLGLVWVIRHNGFITVVFTMLALVALTRSRHVLKTVTAAAAVVLATEFVLYGLFPVDKGGIPAGEALLPDLAAQVVAHPSDLASDDLTIVVRVAPLGVWESNYNCRDSNPLMFGAQLDRSALRTYSAELVSLTLRSMAAHPDVVMSHRWCLAAYLFVPGQAAQWYVQRPPFEIPPNEFGVDRQPRSKLARAISVRVFEWSETRGWLWMTWSPALAIWAGMVSYGLLAFRRDKRFRLAAVLFFTQLANVALTTSVQEFRYAFGVYLLGLLSVPLVWVAFRDRTPRAVLS